jgi:hypothetical protein
MPSELRRLSIWSGAHGVEEAVMEPTARTTLMSTRTGNSAMLAIPWFAIPHGEDMDIPCRHAVLSESCPIQISSSLFDSLQ